MCTCFETQKSHCDEEPLEGDSKQLHLLNYRSSGDSLVGEGGGGGLERGGDEEGRKGELGGGMRKGRGEGGVGDGG